MNGVSTQNYYSYLSNVFMKMFICMLRIKIGILCVDSCPSVHFFGLRFALRFLCVPSDILVRNVHYCAVPICNPTIFIFPKSKFTSDLHIIPGTHRGFVIPTPDLYTIS